MCIQDVHTCACTVHDHTQVLGMCCLFDDFERVYLFCQLTSRLSLLLICARYIHVHYCINEATLTLIITVL